MEEKELTFAQTLKNLFEEDIQKLGIDATLNVGSMGASIVFFHNEEDKNLYRLGGTLKESPYIIFHILNF